MNLVINLIEHNILKYWIEFHNNGPYSHEFEWYQIPNNKKSIEYFINVFNIKKGFIILTDFDSDSYVIQLYDNFSIDSLKDNNEFIFIKLFQNEEYIEHIFSLIKENQYLKNRDNLFKNMPYDYISSLIINLINKVFKPKKIMKIK